MMMLMMMKWPQIYHFKGRPSKGSSLVLLLFLSLLLVMVNGDGSPPVADVEDLFKDEGFLRMSRGGEAFGRRPPPPPLNLNPVPSYGSTPSPPRNFQPSFTNSKDKSKSGPSGPTSANNYRGGEEGSSGPGRPDKTISFPGSGRPGSPSSGGGSESVTFPGNNTSGPGGNGPLPPPLSKPLDKDSSAVFSKVGPNGNGGSGGGSESRTETGSGDSDAHPLLGITPAAPGDPFDFNPILSNPAVTRILAGSSGRIPQWEPTLPDLHELMPEVNLTGGGGDGPGGPGPHRGFGHSFGGGPSVPLPPKTPTGVFVPSPTGSRASPTMYNMDQLTNNIAIPRHTLSNPSNLATSRSTLVDDPPPSKGGGRGRGESFDLSNPKDSQFPFDRYFPGSSSSGGGGNSDNHLDEGGRGSEPGGLSPYVYDEDDIGLSEDNLGGRTYLGSNGEAQGKRGIWKESGGEGGGQMSGGVMDPLDPRDENGPKYIVCDALCGAWKHQCKLMGILFAIISGLCLLFAFVILYSLHFSLRDFLPFSVMLLLLFTISVSRAFILLSGWFCAPSSRPLWLSTLSTMSGSILGVTILVALYMTRFPFPFMSSYRIPVRSIVLFSAVGLGPPLVLSSSGYFHKESQGLLTRSAWILSHVVLAVMALSYLFKFKSFYSRLLSERGGSSSLGSNGGISSNGHHGPLSSSSHSNGNNNCSGSLVKKRRFMVRWGCLQARAMFGASLLALLLSAMIIISVGLGRGECESSISTWTGWILSLCARMLEFAIVILLLLVTIPSGDIRFLSRLTRVPINKSNVGLMNADIFPTMVSSNTAVQRCIPMYSSNARTDAMMLGPTESRSSLRGKTFGERALPGEKLGEYRSSVGRGLPLRLGQGAPHSLPGTPIDGFPPGVRLPEPAPASLLVTKVVFGTPAVSREVNLNHQHDNPLLCTRGPGSKEERETSNIYASLESVKVACMPNNATGSSTGSTHSGSDRVLLSAPRDYIYSISRDLSKTIDSIYDTSRPRNNNVPHSTGGPPLAHTIEQINSVPNHNGLHATRPTHFNLHPHNMAHMPGSGGRTDLARTIDRIRYGASTAPSSTLTTPTNSHPSRNFMLQIGGLPSTHLPLIGNPPPYCSSESSHDVTPDSGIVSDMHSKSGRSDGQELLYSRDHRRSVEDIRRLPILPLPRQHRTPGSTPIYERTPPSSQNNNPSLLSSPPSCTTPVSYIPAPTPTNSIVGRVEHLLNQTEHILSRTESLDSNAHSAGLQRLLSHKEQLEHVERLLAQAEYAIWLEKKNCAQQVSQLSPNGSAGSPYGYGHSVGNGTGLKGGNGKSPSFSSGVQSQGREGSRGTSASNSALVSPTTPNGGPPPKCSNGTIRTSNSGANNGSCSGGSSSSSNSAKTNGHYDKKLSKSLEEESVV